MMWLTPERYKQLIAALSAALAPDDLAVVVRVALARPLHSLTSLLNTLPKQLHDVVTWCEDNGGRASVIAFVQAAHAHNPHFVGRDAELMQLAQTLKPPAGRAAIGQALVAGLGGIGKSQLAAEFAHRYGQFFAGGVFWISFAEPALVPTLLADPALHALADMSPVGFAGLDAPARRAAVKHGLTQPVPRLLIFDNVGEEDGDLALLDDWRPKNSGCRLIVTSRRGSWPSSTGLTRLALNTLPPPAAADLLRALAPGLPQPDADALAAVLGYFPLALYLAGSYLAETGESPAVLLTALRANLLAHRLLDGESARGRA